MPRREVEPQVLGRARLVAAPGLGVHRHLALARQLLERRGVLADRALLLPRLDALLRGRALVREHRRDGREHGLGERRARERRDVDAAVGDGDDGRLLLDAVLLRVDVEAALDADRHLVGRGRPRRELGLAQRHAARDDA